MEDDRTSRPIEWPTVALVVGVLAAWAALVVSHAHLPVWMVAPAFVYLGGLWMSIGHEVLHGHPTRSAAVNGVIGWLPLSMWIPFGRYAYWHRVHHVADLTDPVEDPESFYVSPEVWARLGRVRRSLLILTRTLLGRLTLGVVRGIVTFWWREMRCLGERRIISQWLLHVVLAAVLAWWLFGVMGMSPLLYVGAFVLGGAACTNLRSFAEHLAVADGTRSAVVRAGPVMSLLFLNNNLHHTHHTLPGLAWYRLPAAHALMHSDDAAGAGAGLYRGGYLEVARRYLVRPFDRPDHPLARPVAVVDAA